MEKKDLMKRPLDLKQRLYDKGFNIKTMPSVKRPDKSASQGKILAATLASFKVRENKLEPIIIKPQSIVFPPEPKKKPELVNKFQLIQQTPQSQAKEGMVRGVSQGSLNKPEPIRQDELQLLRSNLKSAVVNDGQIRRTKYLVQKISGKYNIDKRYETKAYEIKEEQQDQIAAQQSLKEKKPNSKLNCYIELLIKGHKNIDKFIYVVKDPTKDNPYDLQILKDRIRGEEKGMRKLEPKKNEQEPSPIKKQQRLQSRDELKRRKEQVRSREQNRRNKLAEYYTISKDGICHYVDGRPIEFIKLMVWLKERQTYNQIKSLKFFTKFRKWKTLKKWRQIVIRHKKRLCSNSLEEKLFFLKLQLREVLLQVRTNAFKMQTLRLVCFENLNSAQTDITYSIDAFKRLQVQNQNSLKKTISQTSEICRESVNSGFKKLSQNLRQMTSSQSNIDQEGKKAAKNLSSHKQAAYDSLGFDSNMNYEKRSKLRKECSRFLRFAYLVDFVAMQSLKNIYLNSIFDIEIKFKQLLDRDKPTEIKDLSVKQINRATDPLFIVKVFPNIVPIQDSDILIEEIPDFTPFHYRTVPIDHFNILVHVRLKKEKPRDPNKPEDDQIEYEQGIVDTEVMCPRQVVPEITKKWLQMQPSADQYLRCIIETLKEAISSIQVFQRWSRHPAMMPYVNILEEWDDKVGDDWQNVEGNFLNPNDWIDKQRSQAFNNQIKRIFQKQYSILQEHIKVKFHIFLMAFWENSRVNLQIFKDERLNNPSQSIQFTLQLLEFQKSYFERQLPNAIEIGLFRIDTSSLRELIEKSPETLLKQLHAILPPWLDEVSKNLKQYMIKSKLALSIMTGNINQFVKQNNSLKEILKKVNKVKDEVGVVGQVYEILESSKKNNAANQNNPAATKESKEWKSNLTDLLQHFHSLQAAIHAAQQGAQHNLQKFAKDVTNVHLPNLQKQVSKIDSFVQEKKYLTQEISVDQAIMQLKKYDEMIKKCEEDSKKYAHYQQTLNLPPSRFQNLENLRMSFNLRFDMWNSLKEWKELTDTWINGKFNQIATEEIKSKSQKYSKIVAKCVKNLPPNPVLEQLKKLLNTFKNTMPIVLALRNPYLQKQYHWRLIKERVGKQFDVQEEGFTLKNLIALDLQIYQQDIIEISTQARQEKALKEAIDQNKIKWEKLTVDIVPYKPQIPKNKDSYVLVKVDQLYASMDELLANFTNILGNRYLKRFRKSAQDCHREIINAQQILDDWMIVQKNWIYLQSIFSSSDIKIKLKDQNAAFQQVNKFLSSHMKKTSGNRILSKNLSTIQTWRKHKETLAVIEKALENYLEEKRNQFPRFYFLSNDELIQILAKANDVEAIQRNIKKCFESVQSLQLPDDGGKVILGVKSPQGQHIVFSKHINKITAIKGQIEVWLKLLQSSIQQTLRKSISKDYLEEVTDRRLFISTHLCQVSSVAAQINWTTETEISLDDQNSLNGIYHCLQGVIKSLTSLTSVIRENIPELQRKIIISLITQDVHNRDVLEMLGNEGVSSKSDFQWVQQLRYYFYTDENQTNNTSNIVLVKQINSQIKYGYEYLGATSRLVITPLTDRCWITITGALNIKLGAAPAGPAGTGKTQSTKDLAKGLGTLCVVFNCSQQIQYKMMGRLFTGLAQQGAWSCLDEFNRIDIEVLSVIAQQLQTIKNAQHKGQQKFLFLDRMISLKSGYGVFITMNPGYAGRTQLPDNLKILFRSVSMMIPDYRLIAEIMLFAQGFENAKSLSKKMVQLYKLSSEQLSQQDHYDFGMRAVKSVLVMAGTLKRAEKDMKEDAVLIRAMRDSNIPKFVKEDLPLFQALISDLFPKFQIISHDYGPIRLQIEQSFVQKGLTIVPNLASKAIQLYDTFNVRFGVMLVGLTMSGKTTCFQVLQRASSNLKRKNPADNRFCQTFTQIINPKSISMNQLYGAVDKFSQEWQDGLASSIIREINTQEDNAMTWIVFDGIVDALWIENMNTVLDDNKMLCLANGQRIKLKNNMRMLFQVNDLRVASPATVSRCGMVYLNCQDLDWRPYINSWLARSFKEVKQDETVQILNEELKGYLLSLMEKTIDPTLQMIRKRISQYIPTADLQLVASLANLLSILLTQKEGFRPAEKIDLKKRFINYAYTYAFIWSFGVTAVSKQHEAMSNFCRDLFQSIIFPNNDNVHMFYLDPEPSFKHWNERLSNFVYEKDAPFHSLYVQTVDSLRYNQIVKLLWTNKFRVFLNGGSGTGKTIYLSRLPAVVHTLTSTTSSLALQLTIESRLQKIKKSLLGAKPGQINIIAIDDVNMPQLQEFGAMPPVEILRVIVDKMRVWDRKQRFLKYIQNTTMVCACSPPGGGRNSLPMRFTRHFNMLSLPETDRAGLIRIFKSIIQGFLQVNNFQESLKRSADIVVNATIQVYDRIRKEKLPIPARFHYTFNLRDFSKVFQGFLQVRSNVVRDIETLSKLWMHQVSRVFSDRLISDQDRLWFQNLIFQLLEANWKMRTLRQEFDKNRIIFGDLLRIDTGRDYQQITDYRKLLKVLDDKMEEYNNEGFSKLHLVFFSDAIEHITRICRVLRQPRGNMLLIGLSGSGKQSLTRFSTFLNSYNLMSLQITKGFGVEDFRKFMRQKMRTTSQTDRMGVFLFSDNQIIEQVFLQDISNLLNSGEIPNLWPSEEMDQLILQTRHFNKLLKRPEDVQTIYRTFVERVRERMHFVMSMSPIGDSLRVRCRKYPGLVDCCTINWFSNWPSQALVSVAHTLLDSVQELPVPMGWQRSRLIGVVADMCKQVHLKAEQEATLFQAALKRKIYTTPKSYLDMLKLFVSKFISKHKEMSLYRQKLSGGLEKLEKANSQVAVLEVQLNELQPQLQRKGVQLAQTHVKLQKDTKVANEIQKTIMQETESVKAKADQIKELNDEANKVLADIQPKLKEAIERINSIQKKDIDTIKGYNKPPQVAVTVMEAVCILLTGKGGDWLNNRTLLLKMDQFIESLQNYPRQSVSEDRLRRIRVILQKPILQQENVKRAVPLCLHLLRWVKTIDQFSRYNQEAKPKKARAQKLDAQLAVTRQILKEKQAQLQSAKDKVQKLQDQAKSLTIKQVQLQNKKQLIKARKQRAGILLSLTKDESIRWKQSVAVMQGEINNLIGDVFVSVSAISYYGPFTGPFRREMVEGWSAQVIQKELPFSQNFNIIKTLGKPIDIRNWCIKGLPSDTVSLENSILATQSHRFPLMIDPQLQAFKWLKNVLSQGKLKQMRFVDNNFMMQMSGAIKNGIPVLVSDVQLNIPPVMQQVLARDTSNIDGMTMVKFGQQFINYDGQFTLFMFTKIPNPFFLPQIFIKVNVINFTVTEEGLQQQLLAQVVRHQRAEIQEQRDQNVVKMTDYKRLIIQSEMNILRLLQKTDQSKILDDLELIETLQTSKNAAIQIEKKMAQSSVLQEQINKVRSQYTSVSLRGSVLFFVIKELGMIDPMYQYSLQYVLRLFQTTIEQSEKSSILERRLQILMQNITKNIYINVTRGLFEEHKLIFSTLITTAINRNRKVLNQDLWLLFLRGPTSIDKDRKNLNPSKQIFSQNGWQLACYLDSNFLKFQGLVNSFINNLKDWIEASNEEDFMDNSLPLGWQNKLDLFDKVLLVKIMRPEKVMFALTKYVERNLGRYYLQSPVVTMKSILEGSDNKTPIIFVLSPGADPTTSLLKFASEEGLQSKVSMISLGQGQGVFAERLMGAGKLQGKWVILQNCHLAKSWMPSLQQILLQNIERFKDIHPEFRVFMTSMPANYFPVSILQNGIKITTEPPRGIKANLKRSWNQITEAMLDLCPKKREQHHKIQWGLTYFHAIVQQRRKFGSIGWNIRYQFNMSDLQTSRTVVTMLLNEQQNIPWQALSFIVGQINYGGRVTDDWDRRCLMTILRKFLNPEIVQGKYHFSEQVQDYYMPQMSTLQQYQDYIEQLPINDHTQVFGMHQNANVTFQSNESQKIINTLLSIQPRTLPTNSAVSTESRVLKLIQDLQHQIPANLDQSKGLAEQFVLDEKGLIPSLSTVLLQQVTRFNNLLGVIRLSLVNLKKAIQGQAIMSSELDVMFYSLINNQVPKNWKKSSYPSLKPLRSWIRDLKERVAFMADWLYKGSPTSFWISGFFFPQGFLTGTMQSHARLPGKQIPIDQLGWSFKITDLQRDTCKDKASEGIFVNGLFLQGAGLDRKKKQIIDSVVNQMYFPMPIIHFIPYRIVKDDGSPVMLDNKQDYYSCPLYKTSERAGVLSTTGQSTNFVLAIDLPCGNQPAEFWVLRGTALLCQLNE